MIAWFSYGAVSLGCALAGFFILIITRQKVFPLFCFGVSIVFGVLALLG